MLAPSFLVLASAVLALAASTEGNPNDATVPATVVMDRQRLVCTKDLLKRGGPHSRKRDSCKRKTATADCGGVQADLVPQLENLVKQADKQLKKGPWSVTNKTMDVPGGTRHDYASQAPYWWPNTRENPDGDRCPYRCYDGEKNPETKNYTDRSDADKMMKASSVLALTWYYTDDAKYRAHAADVVRTWFINEDTKMTPHLQHAQIIPCENEGRSIGIIDFAQKYSMVLDAVAILSTVHDDVWTENDTNAFKEWNVEYLKWLTESDFGKKELAATNNHGTFAAMQISAIAAFVGQDELAKSTLESFIPRIDSDIAANGSLPEELTRSRSWHYSNFALMAWTRMAAVGDTMGVDLWNHVGPEGQSIPHAIEYLIPFATGESEWTEDEKNFDPIAATDVLHFAADRGMKSAQDALQTVEVPSDQGVWAVKFAVEQQDKLD